MEAATRSMRTSWAALLDLVANAPPQPGEPPDLKRIVERARDRSTWTVEESCVVLVRRWVSIPLDLRGPPRRRAASVSECK